MKCILVDDDLWTHEIITSYISKIDSLELVEAFSVPEKAIDFLKKTNEIDLIVLDVEMPNINGFSLLAGIKTKAKVIIISAKADYALNAFSFNVSDYLLKPIKFEDFKSSLLKVSSIEPKSLVSSPVKEVEHIFVRENRRLIKVDTKSILALKSNGDYVVILFKNKERLNVYATLTSFTNKLPHYLLRINRKYIVNLLEIEEIGESGVYLRREYYSIGRKYMEQLTSRLNIL